MSCIRPAGRPANELWEEGGDLQTGGEERRRGGDTRGEAHRRGDLHMARDGADLIEEEQVEDTSVRHRPTALAGHGGVRSRDGEVLSGVLGALGYRTVRGSTSRGGAPALRRLIKTLRAGQDVGMASDGPRGPAWRVQPGIIHLAARTGAPIIPIIFGAARAKTFASWDRFCLPCPFTRVAVVFGRPVRVPPDADEALLEEKRRALEAEMDWTLKAADAEVRKKPLPPGSGGGPDPEPSSGPGGGP